MRRFAFSTLVIGWSAALVVIGAAAQAPQPAAAPASVEFFETKIRPVLASNCFDCHGTAPAPSAGLRLDSREAMLKGGRTGPALVSGDPDNSLLIQAVRQSGALKMPKGGKLAPAEIDALVQWVKDGAAWPAITQSITQSITRS